MGAFLCGVLTFFLLSTASLATSIVAENEKIHPRHCEVSAVFRGISRADEKTVFWNYDILETQDSNCPKKREISLRIPGAEWVEQLGRYTFRVDQNPPFLGEVMKLKLVRIRYNKTLSQGRDDEWLSIE